MKKGKKDLKTRIRSLKEGKKIKKDFGTRVGREEESGVLPEVTEDNIFTWPY